MIVSLLTGNAFVAASGYVFPYGAAMAALSAASLLCTYKVALHEFDFVYALATLCVGEFFAIGGFHVSIGVVVNVVLLTNILGLIIVAVSAGRSVKLAKPKHAFQ